MIIAKEKSNIPFLNFLSEIKLQPTLVLLMLRATVLGGNEQIYQFFQLQILKYLLFFSLLIQLSICHFLVPDIIFLVEEPPQISQQYSKNSNVDNPLKNNS